MMEYFTIREAGSLRSETRAAIRSEIDISTVSNNLKSVNFALPQRYCKFDLENASTIINLFAQSVPLED
jgi:hypothetical protein